MPGAGEPSSSSMRKRATEESELPPKKRRAIRGTANSNPNRPKAANFSTDIQDVLSIAIGHYRCKISTSSPFPSANTERELARSVLYDASEELGLDIEPSNQLIGVVSIDSQLVPFLLD